MAARISSYVENRFGVDIHLVMNATDRNGRPYLTALGSVADTGDAGMVGRGNRFNGLITPMRPMSIEASAGKNPIDHTGKIYSLLAVQIAEDVYRSKKMDCQVFISTSKEKPLETPDEVNVSITKGSVEEPDLSEIMKLVEAR